MVLVLVAVLVPNADTEMLAELVHSISVVPETLQLFWMATVISLPSVLTAMVTVWAYVDGPSVRVYGFVAAHLGASGRHSNAMVVANAFASTMLPRTPVMETNWSASGLSGGIASIMLRTVVLAKPWELLAVAVLRVFGALVGVMLDMEPLEEVSVNMALVGNAEPCALTTAAPEAAAKNIM